MRYHGYSDVFLAYFSQLMIYAVYSRISTLLFIGVIVASVAYQKVVIMMKHEHFLCLQHVSSPVEVHIRFIHQFYHYCYCTTHCSHLMLYNLSELAIVIIYSQIPWLCNIFGVVHNIFQHEQDILRFNINY